jgi:hypothetical protein
MKETIMFSNFVRSTVRRGFVLIAASLCLKAATAKATFSTFSIGGDSTTGSIQSTVDAFRTALGGVNNGNNGPSNGGRREINWDGGGATTATVSGPALSTFTNTRGSSFLAQGTSTGFLQTPVNDPALTSINPSYATTFGSFSPQRIFTPIGGNITDVTFSLPGSNGATRATVSGFGVVFTDVDLRNITHLEFFDAANDPILSLNALPGTTPDASFSFLGALANSGEQIARVRITTGNAPLGPTDTNGSPTDVVAMDDFIYSEPVAFNSVPEPASAALAAFSALGILALRFRRSKHRIA